MPKVPYSSGCQRASIEPIRATPKVPYGRVLVCVEQGGVRALWSSVAFQDCKAYRLIRRAGIRIDKLEGYVRKLHKNATECNELTNERGHALLGSTKVAIAAASAAESNAPSRAPSGAGFGTGSS